MQTATMIRTKPHVSRKVSVSLNTVMPKKMAVAGSKAPSMAVEVEPMCWIAMVVVSNDIAVGSRPKANKFPQRNHLSAGGDILPPSIILRTAKRLHQNKRT